MRRGRSSAIMHTMKKKIRVGFDFDGVVAYNPFRLVRSPWAFFKRRFLGIRKLTFFYPRSSWQKMVWRIMHDSSIYPAKGIDLFRKITKAEIIEAHLVTGRFNFLDDHLYRWLDKYNLKNLFKTINLNKHDEQPHLFKEKIMNKYNLDVFIEDNWDIVEYLHKKQKTKNKKQTKIYWIYNLLDRHRSHPHKFPYLEKALEEIIKSEELKGLSVKHEKY